MLIRIIFSSIIFVQSPFNDESKLRKDCYKSFSIPVIFINLLHYYPTGPRSLSGNFSYTRYSSDLNIKPETVFTQYNFARYDFPCESSTIFTTMGNDFEKIYINIELYHVIKTRKIAEIKYNFYPGFTAREYNMFDLNKNFAVQLKVLNSETNYLISQKALIEDFKEYINSISETKGEICIVTENNRAVMVKLKQESNLPKHYLIGFLGSVDEEKGEYSYRQYTAFLCQRKRKDFEDMVIFITEKNAIKTVFYTDHINYKGKIRELVTSKIEIDNFSFASINYLEKIPSVFNKIFLLTLDKYQHIKNYSDGSDTSIYLSKEKIEYYSTTTNIIKVSNGVEMYANFISSIAETSV